MKGEVSVTNLVRGLEGVAARMSEATDTIDEKLVGVQQLAALTGVSPSTIRRLVRERRIPFLRIRGSIRFSPRKVLEFLAVEPRPPVRRRRVRPKGVAR